MERLEPRIVLSTGLTPAGAEFRVNTQTAGSQELFSEAPQAVAADADGDFVVTWSSAGQDGSGWGVYAQRYAADGSKRGGEFQINQNTAGNQWYPDVACADGGAFMAVWTSETQDGSGDGVYARRYDASGAPAGDEFRVNTTVADNQRQASVAVDAAGDFVVAWAGYGQDGGSGWDVYAQRFDAAGRRAGGELRVNGTTDGQQQFASVAAADSGDFVVTWTTDGQDGSGTAVYARRFDATGVAAGGEFRVNTTTADNQQYSRVTCDAAGGFVVAWASAGQDGSARGIYAQRYSPSGAKRGGEFQVNQVATGEQFAPTVASDDAGDFLVTWTGAQDGDLFGVFARAYGPDGSARGDEFRVNTHTADNQVYGSAASAADGRTVVAWQSDGQDGSQFGVYGQRYAAPPAPPRIVGRSVFYNDSSYDGHDGGAGPADDDAVATDKVALLPGQAAGFANYTSYSRGLNGVMIDVAGWGLPAPVLSSADFACRAGTGPDPAAWAPVPPVSISTRPGAGVGGSDRVTVIWEDGAILRQWLQVTLLATPVTRLLAPDVFYFGNLPGETGDVVGAADVDGNDFFLTRASTQDGPASITNRFDFDRNGRVDVRDLAVIRAAIGQPTLPLLGGPAAGDPFTATSDLRRPYRPPAEDVGLAGTDEGVQ